MRFFLLFLVACQVPGASLELPEEPLQAADSEGEGEYEIEPLRYSDRPGHVVLRWVLTEEGEDGGHHLMVVELPANLKEQAGVMQRTVFDARYSPEDTAEFEARKAFYEHPHDAPPMALSKGPGPGPAFAEIGSGVVWATTKQWTLADETAFGEWVDHEVDEDFFKGSGLQVDCADAALLLRWIYARANGLPVANSLGGSGKLFGNFTVAASWASLSTHADWKQDQRFLAAFRYVAANTYTHSLLGDLYPVQVNRSYVTPGAIHLTIRDVSGHTETIRHMAQPGDTSCSHTGNCLQTIWGNEPPLEQMYLSEMLEMHGNPKGRGGLMRYRWPEYAASRWKLRKADAMPGYSAEQFDVADLEGDAFTSYLYDRLQIVLEPIDRARVAVNLFNFSLGQRRDVTAMGYVMCGAQHCSNYDSYSTPSRDARLVTAARQVQTRLLQLNTAEQNQMHSLLRRTLLKGSPLTFDDFAFDRNGVLSAINSDPTVDYLTRWGLSLGTDDSFRAYVQAWENAWWQRVDAVEQHRDTTSIDRGLRAFASKIRELRTHVSPAVDQSVVEGLSYTVTSSCPASCMLSDYLFGALLDRMTSRAADSFDKRMGLK